MTYGRKNLRLVYRPGRVYPLYLDPERDRDLIREVLQFYLDNEGRRFGDIDWEELRIVVGDDRLYNALRKTMSYFFKPLQVEGKVDPRILRLRVFQLVNTKFGGFVPQSSRGEAIELLKREVGVDGDLDKLLWIDDLDELPLTRVANPSIEDIARVYNLETVDTVCVNSSRISIEIGRYEKLLGNIARSIGRLSKLYGLVYDMRYHGNVFRAVIEGPRSLFRRPTVYGSRLSLLLLKIIDMLYSSRVWWRVESETHLARKTINIEILSNSLKPILATGGIEYEVKQVFDSSIEESIYRVLSSLGIDIRREEEPIALGQLLYLPDFKIYRNGKVYYLEVAGFWRKEYAEKKAYKLREVSKALNNLIVVADENLKPFLEKIGVPVIYYTVVQGKPVLPYKRIIDIIDGK
ncbi:MAG: DUF790 family protein [Ignisphaera sp.]|uniref:DUF790 family protein n=1 Tax=Ignisphaera aggregans TaxID=334771 RepID=A0A7J3I8Q9_9CREN